MKGRVEDLFGAAIEALQRLGRAIIERLEGHSDKAERVLFVSLFAGLALMVAIRGVDSVLAEMHTPDAPSRDFSSLAGLRVGAPDTNAASTTVAIWRAWAGDPARAESEFSTPAQVLGYYFWLDTAFIVFYTTVLLIALVLAHRALRVPPAGREAMEGRIGKAAVDRRETFRRLTRIAVPFLILAAVADFVENLLSRSAYDVCADGCGVWFAYPLATAALLKYGSFLLVLIPLLYAALAIPRRGSGGAWHVFGRLVLVLRVQVIAVVVFTLALFGPIFAEQGADTIRRWPDEDITDGVAAGVLTLLFALLTLVLSWRLLERDASNGKGVPLELKPIPLLAICGVGLVLSIAGLAVLGEHGSGLLSLGVILVVIAFLHFPVRDAAALNPRPREEEGHRVPDAARDHTARRPRTRAGGRRDAPVGVHTRGPLPLPPRRRSRADGRGLDHLPTPRRRVVAGRCEGTTRDRPGTQGRPGGGGASSGQPQSSSWSSTRAWRSIRGLWEGRSEAGRTARGSLAAVSLFGYAIQHFDHDWRPPQAFTALGFSRMPVVLVLVVWAVLAARMDDGGYHDVRPLTEEQSGAAERGSTTTVETAWTRWLAGQTERIEAAPEPRQAVPLVLVAAEGGGLRAAYWTAHALDCALDGDERSCGYELGGDPAAPETLFALSGASGGSLGLASYVAAFVDGVSDEEWVDDRLGRDFVAPLWASLLYVDIPNSFLKLNLLPYCAEVLERSWEQPWHEEASLFDVPESGGPLGGGLFEQPTGSDRHRCCS